MEKNVFEELIDRPDFLNFLENQNIKNIKDIKIDTERSFLINANIFDIYLLIADDDNLNQLRIELSIEDNIWKYELIESNIIKIEDEIKESKLSFDIDYWSYNITYDQLSRLYENEKIIVPDMQRGYVWDHVQASKLIESIIMGLPLPSLFLIKQTDGKYLVVDGLQRITTIGCFRYNKNLPNQEKQSGFKLKGVNVKINNKTYAELEKYEETKPLLDNFDMGTINVIEFKQNAPKYEEAMYFLFERLNSGGTSLSDQQIRNSISYGPFNETLNRIANAELSDLFSKKACENLAPSELLLRSIAVYDYLQENKVWDKKSIVYKKLLNETAEKYHLEYKKLEYKFKSLNKTSTDFKESNEYQTYKDKVDHLFKNINKTFEITKSIFEDTAYKRIEDGEVKNRISATIFESIIVTLLLYQNQLELREQTEITEEYRNIFTKKDIDDDITLYDKYFTQGTGLISNINGRINTMKRVFFKND